MHARTARPLAAASGLALAGLALAGGTPAAYAAPGDNGDVKIHSVGTPLDDQRNEPKVCDFYLAASNFESVQRVRWEITAQPASASARSVDGTLRLTTGAGRSSRIALPDGTYRLTWTFEGSQATGRSKVFQVDCPGGGNGANGNGTNGQTPNGQTPNGQTPNGQTPNGQTPNGQTPNGQTANGQTPNGQNSNGQTANGQAPNGQNSNSWNGSGQNSSGQNSNSWNGGGENGNGGNGGGWNGQRPPQGPVGAGGGGSAELAAAEDGSSFGVGAAVAAGLAGTVGLVLIRRSRRRNDGAA
ncbi:hypothetical protein ACF1BN_33295 [Streptomyces sp. NPDC014861]|uniref:hypothetical protein n=1 Tax=Streptomyces sp. NPDC014861 TaxID=3364923 RepID=UPI0036FA23EF